MFVPGPDLAGWTRQSVKLAGKARRRTRARRAARHPSRALSLEPLEPRALLALSTVWTPADPVAASLAASVPLATTPIQALSGGGLVADGTSAPQGLSPAQVRHAYNVDSIQFAKNITGDGTGQTIAIVDAYNDPNLASDLIAFDQQFSLPNPSFSIIQETGTTNAPVGDWGIEETLDVEWAHAIAPGANIVLVEASAADINLYYAAQYAGTLSGVSVVSMSWGGGEFNGETSLDSYFSAPGVTFVAATGDSGKPGGYPAYSPNVLATGGTYFSPALDSAGDYSGEVGWNDSGGGISTYESQPSFQHGIVTQSTTARTIPDVSMNADTGVSIYDSYDESASQPWVSVGGTSLAAPSWAGLIAIADQGSSAINKGNLSGPTVSSRLYGLAATAPSTSFHDITSGNNGYQAAAGYDLVTGIGTPMAEGIVGGLSGNWLVHTPSVTNATTTENTQTTSGLVITPNALDNGDVTNYQITGITGGTLYLHDGVTAIANNSFITAAQGAAGLKFTPTTNSTANGSFSVQASVTADTTGLGGSTATATITVTPVAHTPSVTNATTTENTQTTSGLVITPNALDNGVVTNYQITGITGGTLYLHDGVTAIANNSFITVAQGSAGLKFTPTTNSTANGSFSVQASTTADTTGLGGSTVTATITVTSTFVLGDMNGDGVVNNFDISPFEQALANPSAYLAQYPSLTNYAARGDINADGYFNNFDISPFEVLLTASGAPPSSTPAVTSAVSIPADQLPALNSLAAAAPAFTPVVSNSASSAGNLAAQTVERRVELPTGLARPTTLVDDSLLELLSRHGRRV